VGNPTTAELALYKTVDKAIALPGQNLTYTINYNNPSPASLKRDVPANLTAVAMTAPTVGTNGSIQWSFTGNLISGGSGSVSFVVRIKY
jgi:uncharacterized repeat protein (TIGR01451 family)